MHQIARRIIFGFFQTVEISPTQLFTIMLLQEKGPCHFSVLGTALNVAAPTVTGIIDRLEKGCYVKRVPDQNDRRAINIVLTSKGTVIAKKLRKTIEGRWAEVLSPLPLEEQENYLRILKQIQGNIS